MFTLLQGCMILLRSLEKVPSINKMEAVRKGTRSFCKRTTTNLEQEVVTYDRDSMTLRSRDDLQQMSSGLISDGCCKEHLREF